MVVSLAQLSDIPELVKIVNDAYDGGRGVHEIHGEKNRSWTSEFQMVQGPRLKGAKVLEDYFSNLNCKILKFTDDTTLTIKGCILLEKSSISNTSKALLTVHLGMLSVNPTCQGQGIGKILMAEAEKFAQIEWKVSRLTITVINERTELLKWYEKMGWKDSGERRPFNKETGEPICIHDIEYIVMEKFL